MDYLSETASPMRIKGETEGIRGISYGNDVDKCGRYMLIRYPHPHICPERGFLPAVKVSSDNAVTEKNHALREFLMSLTALAVSAFSFMSAAILSLACIIVV